MKQLLLFAETLDQDQCLSIGLDDRHSEVLLALETRALTDILRLQNDYQITLVIPQTQCSIHQVELPWISPKKARLAIPFALEDHCAQPISQLHFAFDKHFYHQNHYLVLTCEKSILHSYLNQLNSASIRVQSCSSDWFALDENFSAVSENYVISNTQDFKGALPNDMLDIIPQQGEQTFLIFEDSPTDISPTNTQAMPLNFKTWVAQQLKQKATINLLQGEFRGKNTNPSHQRMLWVSAGLAVVWIVSIFFVNIWTLYRLKNENYRLEQSIETVYKNFFPTATQVINPRFRIGQLLKAQSGNENDAFWKILLGTSLALQEVSVDLKSLQYTSGKVSINIICDSFKSLESFEQTLESRAIRVKQLNASSMEQQVNANLELSI